MLLKKKEAALALALVGIVSAACLRGMMAVSRRIEEKMKKKK